MTDVALAAALHAARAAVAAEARRPLAELVAVLEADLARHAPRSRPEYIRGEAAHVALELLGVDDAAITGASEALIRPHIWRI